MIENDRQLELFVAAVDQARSRIISLVNQLQQDELGNRGLGRLARMIEIYDRLQRYVDAYKQQQDEGDIGGGCGPDAEKPTGLHWERLPEMRVGYSISGKKVAFISQEGPEWWLYMREGGLHGFVVISRDDYPDTLERRVVQVLTGEDA